jgi:hypothetical protein
LYENIMGKKIAVLEANVKGKIDQKTICISE